MLICYSKLPNLSLWKEFISIIMFNHYQKDTLYSH